MDKIIFLLFVLALSAFAQKISVAVLPSESMDASLSNTEENAITNKMREAALNVLPSAMFTLLNQDAVVKRLGGAENYIKECRESSCIVDLGKKAQVDYVAKAVVSKMGGKFMLNVELYNVSTSGLVGVYNGEADNAYGLLGLIGKNVPDAVFRKIPGASRAGVEAPSIARGISGVQSGSSSGFEVDFGILHIKPAYFDDGGKNENWIASIDGRIASSMENILSPKKYSVKLSHRCYEDISFDVVISKGSREVFDMSKHISSKQGGLALSAEKDGQPASEPVFVDGKQIGETPFSGTVAVCSEIEIGSSREKIAVKLENRQTVRHTHKIVGSGVLTDARDGKKYKTVKIGSQTWMAENLNYNASGSKCYANKTDNCAKYGRLYNWQMARPVCPKGWHLPSKAEWEKLTSAVGGEKTEGLKLKAKSGWNSHQGKYGNGTDDFGFSALPGGLGYSDGRFRNVGDYGYWWSSSESYSFSAYFRYMYYYDEYAIWNYYDKSFLFSVRCVQD